MTNFEKITATPDSLAELFLKSIDCECCPCKKECNDIINETPYERVTCTGTVKWWLKKEVTE